MTASILKSFIISILISLCLSTADAKELSPIEKALKALAEKNLLVDSHQTTGTAYHQTPGNTLTATNNGIPLAESSSQNQNSNDQLTALKADNHSDRIDSLGLTANATAEYIYVSWSNTASAWTTFGGYELTRTDLTGDHALSVTRVVMPVSSYKDVSVTAKTYYRYYVEVMDTEGNSLVASNHIISGLLPSQPPKTPENFEALNLSERVQLKWDKVERTSHDLDGYLIYRKQPANESWLCLNPEKPTPKVEYYDQTGEINKWYQYYVVAIDQRGLTSTASNTTTARARSRDRNGLIWMSTAYRGLGKMDTGLNADFQFSYYIGTLYGEQDPALSTQALYLDPISVWILSGDVKYTALTEDRYLVTAAVGAKGGLQLFAGQQSTSSGEFSFSEKSELDYLFGGYVSVSRSFGQLGIHGGYSYGQFGYPVFFLSKYLEVEDTSQVVYAGLDFPIVRRMNAVAEVILPLANDFTSKQNPLLVNLHVDRLFNFDIAYLKWNQGWGLLGYFNIRFTVFPGK